VINGKSNITNEFAQKLAIALNSSDTFWINLQANYDKELFYLKQSQQISDEEHEIAREIKKPVADITGEKFGDKLYDEIIYELRKILGVNNLTAISHTKLANQGLYRRQFAKGTSHLVMYTWQYLCEQEVYAQNVAALDLERLKKRLPNIKRIMFAEPEKIIRLIQEELNSCGVYFTVKKHVEKAPINGLTVKTMTDNPLIALTLRHKFVDIFWFTLFHEIGHIIFGDYLQNDLDEETSKKFEKRANKFAEDTLINPEIYQKYISNYEINDQTMAMLAQEAEVLPSIVYSRLMKDKKIPRDQSHHRARYEWAEKAIPD
jgi:HTH-type transcriptional regulator/antitoxin HigA